MKKKIILGLIIISAMLININFSFAVYDQNGLGETLRSFAGKSGLTPSENLNEIPPSLLDIITAIIKVGLSFLGVIFLILIIVAGFKWMTTSSPDEIKKIRAKIINATIGLVIVLAAYGLTTFISGAIFASLKAS